MRRRMPPPDLLADLPSGAPASRRDQWRAAFYITSTASVAVLVVLAVAFEQFAATGVLLVGILSFVLTYLIAPAVERLRYRAAPSRRGRPLSRGTAVLMIYGMSAAVTLPLWTLTGARFSVAMERMHVLVPEHTARFVGQLHAGERWHEALRLPSWVRGPVDGLTRRVVGSLGHEARALSAELIGVRRLVPWLSTVPVVAFLLLTRWTRFRRSTTRVLPTPHLQWRGNELLRNFNSLLAAYTRAQTLSGLIVGAICWIGFAVLGASYPGTLAIAAGLLEIVPVAGPIIVAVVATAAAPDRVMGVLIFLATVRLIQDYVIYPRLISRTLHLHPMAVIVALWMGAALGGIVGVCLAIPMVGAVLVTYRHWREYRDIEALVADRERQTG